MTSSSPRAGAAPPRLLAIKQAASQHPCRRLDPRMRQRRYAVRDGRGIPQAMSGRLLACAVALAAGLPSCHEEPTKMDQLLDAGTHASSPPSAAADASPSPSAELPAEAGAVAPPAAGASDASA